MTPAVGVYPEEGNTLDVPVKLSSGAVSRDIRLLLVAIGGR